MFPNVRLNWLGPFSAKGATLNGDCTFIFILWRRLFEWRINGDSQNLNLFLFTEGASLNGEIMEISIPFSAKGATLNFYFMEAPV